MNQLSEKGKKQIQHYFKPNFRKVKTKQRADFIFCKSVTKEVETELDALR